MIGETITSVTSALVHHVLLIWNQILEKLRALDINICMDYSIPRVGE
jgi:hypothetical protein